MLGRDSSLIAAIVVATVIVGFESTVAPAMVFELTNGSTMMISGTVLGTPLEPAVASSGFAFGLTGSFDVLVDDLGNPTQMTIASGTLDIGANIADGPFLPGVGGTNTPANADFAFTASVAPSDVVKMAIRSLLLSLSSDGPLMLSGSRDAAAFRADLIGCTVAGGFSDVYSPSLGGTRIDLAGMTATPTEEETGILNMTPDIWHDVYGLTFVYERTIDLSAQIPGTVLTISGTIDAECAADVPEPSTVTILVSGVMGLLFWAWRRAPRLR